MNCRSAQPMLSDYIDNALSARHTWEVDRHLAECNECTRTLNELRRTVALVASAPRHEVSDDFMARLQARISAVEPQRPRWNPVEALREFVRPRAMPLWGAAIATAALAIVMVVPHGGSVQTPIQQANIVPASVQEAVGQNVAISASDPLADLGTANLQAHATTETEVDQAE